MRGPRLHAALAAWMTLLACGAAVDVDSVEPIEPGNWGDWGMWTDCSVTCGDGERSRFRVCDNPAPMPGGKMCEGDSAEREGCNEQECIGIGKGYIIYH